MSNLNKFIHWLSFNPSYDEIAQALLSEYLNDLNPEKIRFGRINPNDSAEILGQYGYHQQEVPINVPVPGEVWRSLDLPEIHIIKGENKSPWSPDGEVCVVVMRDRGATQGHAVLEFKERISVQDREQVLGRVNDYCTLLSLYISFHNTLSRSNTSTSTNSQPDWLVSSRVGSLTDRQFQVLRGIVDGKTNVQIARQLGYSVSTIRQETMKIYAILSVNDRWEAAKRATKLSLV